MSADNTFDDPKEVVARALAHNEFMGMGSEPMDWHEEDANVAVEALADAGFHLTPKEDLKILVYLARSLADEYFSDLEDKEVEVVAKYVAEYDPLSGWFQTPSC